MASVLFVDDEPRVLEGIENMLFDQEDWTLRFATSGEAALQILAATPDVGVLVTDMRMPSMDGLQLLQAVMQRHPGVIRMVLSGHAELAMAMKAITIAHQYLGKPCEQATLVKALDRALHIGQVIKDDALRCNLGRLCESPRGTQPQELQRCFANPTSTVTDLARAVARDVALTTKVLQAANSSIFGASPATTLGAAINRIGMEGVRSLAVAIDVLGRVAPAASAASMDGYLHSSLDVATIAASIATVDADRAYLAGLLRDIGRIALASLAPERLRRVAAMVAQGMSTLTAEIREFGIDHAALGAELLELCGIPDLADVVRFHHKPSDAPGPAQLDALGAVHLADVAHVADDAMLDAVFVERLGPAASTALAQARALRATSS
jgi:HD-like signal output (HDOD) protein/CheY-like chemotaxis protein